MDLDHIAVSRRIMRWSVVVFLGFLIVVLAIFTLKQLPGYLAASAASLIYFLMLRNRIAKVVPGERGMGYMLRGMAVRFVFIIAAIAVLFKLGFNPFIILMGIMVTPLGNKLYSLNTIIKGVREFKRR